jgi:hypothetical protein
MTIQKYDWTRLNHLQIGKYAEYFVKMEFTLYGFDVYSSEVDDRGIDLVIRRAASHYYDVQVKSTRGLNYIFFPKAKFPLRDNLLAAIVIFMPEREPALFLVPAPVWESPNLLFVNRDYKGKQSKPEWGLNLSHKNLPLLEPYRFETVVETL